MMVATSGNPPAVAAGTTPALRDQVVSAETVAALGQAGGYLSLALDSQGQGHVAYWSGMQTENGQLVYAVHSSRGWQHEVVASTLGAQTAIALDEVGRPLIAFIDLVKAELRLARLPQQGWQIETVATDLHSFAPGNICLALDNRGRPLISYFSQDKLHLARQSSSGTWKSSPLTDGDGNPGSGFYHDLALDSRGRAVIAAHNLTTQAIHLLQAADDGAVSVEPVTIHITGEDELAPVDYLALALDGADQPHVCYRTAAGLSYATRTEDGWLKEVIEAAAGSGLYAAIQAGKKGQLVASYYDATRGHLKLARRLNGAWNVELVDEDGDTGGYIALALDKRTTAHIAYYDWDAEAVKFVRVSAPPLIIQWKPERHISYGERFYHRDPVALDPEGGEAVKGAFVIQKAGHPEPLNANSILEVGLDQTLLVKFTPDDLEQFAPVERDYKISVSKARSKITWPAQANLVYGDPLGADQLNATASAEFGDREVQVTGSLFYFWGNDPIKPGDKLPLGQQSLSVQFEPDEREHYKQATKTVQLRIGKAIHILQPGETFSDLAQIYYGDPRPHYWFWILDANKDIPEDYTLTRPGTKIFIPEPPPKYVVPKLGEDEMDTSLETSAKQPGQLSARIWLGIAFTIFVVYIAGQLGSFLFPGALQAYGVGFEKVTLEGIFIQAGFFTIYGILSTLPLLMVIGYQRSQLVTLKSKIREDLWLCGLDSRQMVSKMQAFGERNSWSSYILPAVLSLIFLAVQWSYFLMPAGQSGLSLSLLGDPLTNGLNKPDLVNMLNTIATSASVINMTFLGAYFYILSVLTRRWQQADLTTGVLWRFNVRLAVALLVGILLTAAAPDTAGIGEKVLLVIGFLAGIIPDTVLRWVSQRAMQIVSPKGERKNRLFVASELQEKIEGLNFWQADRLFEEGIESVQDLAMKEIPDLLIETRFDTPHLLYWVDQALLSNQVGEHTHLFQGAFIKTASDLTDLAEKNEQDLEKVLQAIQDGQQIRPNGQTADGVEAGAFDMTLGLLENIVEGLRNGPNLPYAREYWRNTSSPQRRAAKLAELDNLLSSETGA